MVREGARQQREERGGALAALAAAYAWAGHDKEAKNAVAELLKIDPYFIVQDWKRAWARNSDDPTFNAQLDRILEGLRKAGVPEGAATSN